MKYFLILLIALADCNYSMAQTASTTKIMDAKVTFTNNAGVYHGIFKIYLTDVQDLGSLDLKIGSTNNATDLYDQQFSITALPSGSSIVGNNLLIDIGNFITQTDFYVKAKIILTDAEEREIQFHASN